MRAQSRLKVATDRQNVPTKYSFYAYDKAQRMRLNKWSTMPLPTQAFRNRGTLALPRLWECDGEVETRYDLKSTPTPKQTPAPRLAPTVIM
jgi:hypothetical protein